MRAFTGSQPDWLTEVRLPAYAPDINAVEGAWANMKNGLGQPNGQRRGPAHRDHQESAQANPYRPALIDGFLAQTGLTLEPQPP